MFASFSEILWSFKYVLWMIVNTADLINHRDVLIVKFANICIKKLRWKFFSKIWKILQNICSCFMSTFDYQDENNIAIKSIRNDRTIWNRNIFELFINISDSTNSNIKLIMESFWKRLQVLNIHFSYLLTNTSMGLGI